MGGLGAGGILGVVGVSGGARSRERDPADGVEVDGCDFMSVQPGGLGCVRV